ncbi:hypothetical protein [Sphingobacterium anhuiense]|uniref:hypothetical protein n=1 Tax=Sphingobacterium anhuiense TaxID=493780 RepID=UPI003C2DC365
MNQYEKYFCTFADSRLNNSLKRIENQAKQMRLYDDIIIFNEYSLDSDFRNQFKKELIKGSRGYGYWCWKPQVILQMFEKMNYGDVLQYSDSGCHLNSGGISRLKEYFEIAKKSASGLLAFRTKELKEISENEVYYGNTVRRYTKGDVLKYFDVLDNEEILNSVQYEAGIIFIRKDEDNINFIKTWINTFSVDFNLINDAPSTIPNKLEFIDHRHDQSIYSLLCKLRGVETLYSSEYFVPDSDWKALADFPIWVKRDKNFSFTAKVRMFPMRVLNFLKRKLRG